MKCPFCKAEVHDVHIYCEYCGKFLQAERFAKSRGFKLIILLKLESFLNLKSFLKKPIFLLSIGIFVILVGIISYFTLIKETSQVEKISDSESTSDLQNSLKDLEGRIISREALTLKNLEEIHNLFLAGLELKNEQNYQPALQKFNDALTLAPKLSEVQSSPEADSDKLEDSLEYTDLIFAIYFYRGLVQLKLELYPEAVESFSSAQSFRAEDPALLNNLAVTYFHIGNYSAALEIYNQLLAQNPEDADTYVNLANLLATTEGSKPALENLEKALQLNPLHLDALYSKAQLFEKAGDLKAFEDTLKFIIQNHPKFEPALLDLGDLYFSKGLKYDPNVSNANYLQQAEDLYRQALDANPDYYQTYLKLAKLYRYQKLFSPAYEQCYRALNKEPEIAFKEAHTLLAWIDFEHAKYEEAQQECNEILKKYPEDLEAIKLLSLAQLQNNQAKEALLTLEEEHQKNPKNAADVSLNILLATVYEALEESSRAYKLLQKISYELEASNSLQEASLAYLYLGRLEYRLGNILDAQGDLNKALKLNPSQYEALSVLAIIEAQSGNIKNGLVLLNNALDSPNPDMSKQEHNSLLYLKGMLLFSDGQFQAAADQFQNLNEMDPDLEKNLLQVLRMQEHDKFSFNLSSLVSENLE